jgi:hypothetical protein
MLNPAVGAGLPFHWALLVIEFFPVFHRNVLED